MRPLTMSVTMSLPRRLVRRGVRALGTLALVAVTLVAAAFVLAGVAGFQRYVIVGGSMSGTFEVGAVAFDRPVPVADLRVGDIITYQPPPDSGVPNLVSHRIISIRHIGGQTVYHTKGDANPDPDPWRFRLDEPTQPRVVFTVPYAGYLFMGLTHRWLRVALIGVPAGLVALSSLGELAGLSRKKLSRKKPATAPATAS
jgi:signal peptidase